MKHKLFLVILLGTFSLAVFAQQADMSLIPYRKGDLWGYATPDKKIVIKPVYQDANPFHAGYASVRRAGLYGYINKEGKVVIPFKFFSAKPFRYGYRENSKTNGGDTVLFAGASLTAASMEKCIDTRGNPMAKCPAINENSVRINDKPLISDILESSFSTLVKSETFDKVVDQYKLGGEETYYIAVKNDQYGVINNKFETIAPFEYSVIKKLLVNNTIYLLVNRSGMKGILKANGSVLLDLVNSRLDPVYASDGVNYFIITTKDNTGIKNIGMQELVAAKYSDIQYDNAGGFIITAKDNLRGCYFLNNKMVEPKYMDVNIINSGNFARVKTAGGKFGYISSNGIEFFEE